jgi:hypothetical protein
MIYIYSYQEMILYSLFMKAKIHLRNIFLRSYAYAVINLLRETIKIYLITIYVVEFNQNFVKSRVLYEKKLSLSGQ